MNFGTTHNIDVTEKQMFVFVILHYNVTQETVECIESIIKTCEKEYIKIVVVDNHSTNESTDELVRKYKSSDIVTIIINEKNLGFAKGNNVGIKYARENFQADFVCCLNNDTLLYDKEFIYNCICEYERSGVAVIGPKVILKNGIIQKFKMTLEPIEEYERQLHNLEDFCKVCKRRGLKSTILNTYLGKILYNACKCKIYKKRKENVILHGCCLIFTPSFFEKLEGFDERTFMFREEELLYLLLKKNNLLSVYLPCIWIKHMEDASTDSTYKTDQEKKKFLMDNQEKSINILIETLNSMESIETKSS